SVWWLLSHRNNEATTECVNDLLDLYNFSDIQNSISTTNNSSSTSLKKDKNVSNYFDYDHDNDNEHKHDYQKSSTNCTILISNEFDIMNDPLEEAITNSNNNVHIPTNKEIEDTINYGEVKNTTHNTRFWLKVLTSVRTKMGYNYDINKSPYAPTSIKNCFAAAIHKYLQENSKISPALDLYDECMFPRLHKHLDGKIKKMQDLSIIKQKKSDSLEYDEIYQILTHPELNKGTPLSTTYKTYFWLCFLCGFCGGDAQRLKLANKRINDQLKTRILEIVGHPVNLFDLDKNGKLIPMPQSSYSREKVVAEIVAQLRGKTIRAPDIAYAPKEIDCQLDAQQNWSLKVILSPLYLLSKSETFQVIQNPENKEIHIDRRDRRRINHGWKEVDNVDFLLMFTLVIWKIKHVISQRESISPEPSSFSCNSCSETFTDPYVMITHVEDKHAYKRRH
ncbi:2670_t:CDS:2, partial [Entrophospora sp. SA101]